MKSKNISPDAIALEIGDRLKQARLNANLTQSEIAIETGLNRRTIINAEKGKVQLKNLIAILASLQLSDHLDSFLPVQEISPMQLAKLKGQARQRASGSKVKKVTKQKSNPSW